MVVATIGILFLVIPGKPSTPVVDIPQTAYEERVYLSTDRSGVYELHLSDLGGDWANIDPRQLKLTHRGIPVQIWLQEEEGRGGGLRFWGQPSDSLYTDSAVYILSKVTESQEVVPPPMMDSQSVTNATQITVYQDRVVYEDNLIYTPFAPLEDSWFWSMVGAPGVFETPITIPNGALDPMRISVHTWTNTEAGAAPDHRIEIYINDTSACSDLWDGKGFHTSVCDLPAGSLTTGKQKIIVKLPGIEDVPAEIIYLDSIQVDFMRPLNLSNDEQVVFQPEVDGEIQITESSDIYKNNPGAASEWVGASTTSLNIETGSMYALVKTGYKPVITKLRIQANLDQYDAADYLIIGEPDLLEAVNPLAKFRSEQGLKVLLISSTDIYDHYGYGYPEPTAIQSFITHTQTWSQKPTYVLLLGDASYDPLGYVGSPMNNQLPTFFTDTEFGGYTATDIPFVDVDDDGMPDLAVGRLPAQTGEQLEQIVKKILRYETKGTPQSNNILLVADGREPVFLVEAETFGSQFSFGDHVSIYSPEPGTKDVHKVIIQGFLDGQGLVAYFGHGSLEMWGQDQLFTREDAQKLNNLDDLPIVINFTCLTGLYTHPNKESISEALLWNTSGGAVAVLAPTSLTLSADQSFLAEGLAKNLVNHARLGDVILQAWRQAPEREGAREVMRTFILLGDPALVLTFDHSNTSR